MEWLNTREGERLGAFEPEQPAIRQPGEGAALQGKAQQPGDGLRDRFEEGHAERALAAVGDEQHGSLRRDA